MILTPAQLIDDLGAPVIADKLGLPVVTVRMWKSRNRIPRTAWPELIGAFKNVNLEQLLKVEKAA